MSFRRRHGWTVAVLSSLPILLIAGVAWTSLSDSPILLARLDEDERRVVYGALASTAGALLGFTITALAILIALPSSETVTALRRFPGWRTLFELLLAAIVLLGVLLVSSLVALTTDVTTHAHETLAVVVLASAVSAGIAIAAVGLFFGLVVVALSRDWD